MARHRRQQLRRSRLRKAIELFESAHGPRPWTIFLRIYGFRRPKQWHRWPRPEHSPEIIQTIIVGGERW